MASQQKGERGGRAPHLLSSYTLRRAHTFSFPPLQCCVHLPPPYATKPYRRPCSPDTLPCILTSHLQVPTFSGVSPSFGPMSGGTNITVHGTHLGIGASRAVIIGTNFCRIHRYRAIVSYFLPTPITDLYHWYSILHLYSINDTTIECATGKSEHPIKTFQVLVKIDGRQILTKAQDSLSGSFSYMADPLIKAIFPTTATFRFVEFKVT